MYPQTPASHHFLLALPSSHSLHQACDRDRTTCRNPTRSSTQQGTPKKRFSRLLIVGDFLLPQPVHTSLASLDSNALPPILPGCLERFPNTPVTFGRSQRGALQGSSDLGERRRKEVQDPLRRPGSGSAEPQISESVRAPIPNPPSLAAMTSKLEPALAIAMFD